MKKNNDPLTDEQLEALTFSRDLIATLRRLNVIDYPTYEDCMQEIILRMLRGSINDIKTLVNQNKGITGTLYLHQKMIRYNLNNGDTL